jgi:beta-lactamase regulating signal transducer with metallopeptidase domain
VWCLLAVGAALLLLRFSIARRVLQRSWQQARPIDDPQIAICAQRVGIEQRFEVRVSETPIAPLAWGGRVLLPPGFPDWPLARRRDVLLHEFVHIARRDSRVLVFAALVRAAYWFSPAAWFALRELRIAQELSCDERVLSHGVAAVDYAQSLVDVAALESPTFAAGVSAMARRSSLERRVQEILGGATVRSAGRGIALGAMITLLAAGALIAAAQPVDPKRTLSPLAPLAPLSSLATPLVPLATPLAPGRDRDAHLPATAPGRDPGANPVRPTTTTR